MIQALYSKY